MDMKSLARAVAAAVTEDEVIAAFKAAMATKAPKVDPTFTGTVRGAALNFSGTGNFGGLLTLLAGLDVTGATNFKGAVSGLDPVAAQQFVTLNYLNQQLAKSGGVPAGTLIHFAGKSVPDGYLIANGAGVPVADYPALYAAIGNTYGGNSTTFYLPNLSGRFLEGTTSTSSVGSYYSAGLPNITGGFVFRTGMCVGVASTNGAFSASETISTGWTSGAREYGDKYTVAFSAANSTNVFGSSSDVQPPSMAALVLIKT
jgi:microcystin-dependent protein